MDKHTKTRPSCPPLWEVLDASDGTLPKVQIETIAQHLRTCERCRRQWRETETLLQAWHATVPADEPTDAERQARFLTRLRRYQRRSGHARRVQRRKARVRVIARWLPIAAALVLAIGLGVVLWQQTPVVRADDVLESAARVQQAQAPAFAQRVRLQVTARGSTAVAPDIPSFATEITLKGGRTSDDALRGVPTAASERLGPLFDAARLDLQEPFSVARVQAWRQSLTTTHENVIRTGDLFVVRTTTPTGHVREIEVTIRAHTYHVVRVKFVFHELGTVLAEEVAQWTDATEASAPWTAGGVTPAADFAHVAALFDRLLQDERTRAFARLSNDRLDAWVDRRLGPTHPRRATFAADFWRLTATIQARLTALDVLARRYPETAVRRYPADLQDRLHRLVDVQYQHLRRDLQELDDARAFLSTSVPRCDAHRPRSETSMPAPRDWRRRSSIAVPQAGALIDTLRALSRQPGLGADEIQPVDDAFDRLWMTVWGQCT